MGSLQRILKNFFALFVSNVTSVMNQALLPPIFLHRYGTVLYGEWLALSVAVAYLSTLNFGVQTFVNQDLAVRYHRGELDGYQVRQSTALRLLMGICGMAAVMSLIVFCLNPQRLLHLTISNQEARLALYLLALQVLVNILFGYFSGTFMVVEKAHRGSQWNNFQRAVLILATVVAAWLRVSLSMLAAVQLTCCVLVLGAVLVDLRRLAPEIFPSIRYWDGATVMEILSPSGHFALIFSCTFLAFQAPILILQRIVGPVGVVAFSLMRTIFSMSRQILAAPTQSLGPEITNLFAKNDWTRLRDLYVSSERLVFACIPTVSIGVLVASPWLLSVWRVDRSGLFLLYPYVISAAISILMATKEHKYQFQFSTNSHKQLARFMFGSYLILIGISIPMVHFFHTMGFLGCWLVVEATQLAYIVRLNHDLFDPLVTLAGPLDHHNLLRMLTLSIAGLVGATYVLNYTSSARHLLQVVGAILSAAVVATISIMLFDLKEVIRGILPRLRGRTAVG